ncbi:MAG: Uma2 family endonuclease [Actinobacteria bacterium]|nr:Uma2 family endonuclease [Actinomycetota bacterium]MBO0836076.1 Uma2 family endonuclease [Actinomycetota bacterium]
MSAGMLAPAWMHLQVTADEYDSWSEEQCAGIPDFDVRLQDVPLTNRRPDVVVYRAAAIDNTPMRPEHVALVVEVVSPGSETTDRIAKPSQYAEAGIPFYWRVEQLASSAPVTYTYVLDPATRRYRDSDVFTGTIKVSAPFAVEIHLEEP